MAEWPGAEVKEWPGQEYTTSDGGTTPAKESTQIDVSKLTDPHEKEFVEGRRGTMSEQDLEESIRQYRAIKKADQDKPVANTDRNIPREQAEATPAPAPGKTFTVPTNKPTIDPIVPKKPWYEPRLGWSDIAGPSGQNALAAGLATAALTPEVGLGIPGFIAGAGGALLGEEGTRRLQEDMGEVPGYFAGLGAGIVSGGLAGLAGRARPMGPFKNVSPPEPVIPPQEGPQMPATGLYETVPRGGAYASQELLTEPSSRISGEHQFSTGSGTSLFGEGQVPFAQQDQQFPSQPVQPKGFATKMAKPKGTLPEKYPTIEEQVIPEGQLANEAASMEAGKPKAAPKAVIDSGTTTPDGQTYIPPREYREAPNATGWRKWWNVEKQRWGQEMPVLKTHPNSPVISSIEGAHVIVEDAIENLSRQPWLKNIMKLGDNKKIAPMEAKWVADFKAGKDYSVPPEIKTMMEHRTSMLAEENAIRRRRGLPEIHETPGPYLPRMTDEEFRLLRVIAREHEGAKASSSVGPFANSRVKATMEEGLLDDVTYADWRKAMLLREVRGQILKSTDQMMTDLETAKVLHRTKEGAEQASLTGKAYPVDGLPFEPEGGWWVRSAEERQFLLQNLRKFESLSDIRTWINQYIRNPSLVNPWPHIVKNMGLKQMQQATVGGLNPAAVLKNTFAYRQMQAEAQAASGNMLNPRTWLNEIPRNLYPKGVDMLDEFKRVMPFTESGRTVWELMSQVGPRTMVERISGTPGVLNGYARGKIFAEWDPAMRYGLWREYVKKGMSPEEAANNTWVDLIRYGTRADRIDAWNKIPFNFFVPWRVGTVRTMAKAIQSAPVRFGLFMGAVDILREYDLRQNGRWTHLPYDYIERPLMTLLTEGPSAAAQTALSTLVFGPGGDYALRTLGNLIKAVEGKGGVETVRTLGWGLAQMYDLWPQWDAYQKDGNVNHIVDMFGLVLLGRHGAPYGGPPRLMKYMMPESVIPYTTETQKAEDMGDKMGRWGDMKEKQKTLRDMKRMEQPMRPTIPAQE